MPKVAIVYLVWSNEPEKYFERALKGVIDQTYNKADTRLLVIYNSHKPNEASQLPLIQELIEKNKNILPETTILSPEKNLGFSGGNNLGMQWAIDNNFDYVFLHNADGFLAPLAIEKMVNAMDEDKKIGQAQSVILLYPERDLINTVGNSLHYLNIGFCGDFHQPIADKNLPLVYDVGYVSGAATMMRVSLLKKYGLWHEEFFMYHEDTEYSLRLKTRGFRVVAVRDSVFYHEYQFIKDVRKFYWMERNRQILKYLFFRWPTIILMLPLELIYYIGLMFVAIKNNWIKEFFGIFSYWFKLDNWKKWKNIRKINQAERVVSDRFLLSSSEKTVKTAEMVVPEVIKILANSVFTFYYYLLKILVWW